MFMFFFFKQKTAYEMRMSDWSSDVCSSDLVQRSHRPSGHQAGHDDGGQEEEHARHRQQDRQILAQAGGGPIPQGGGAKPLCHSPVILGVCCRRNRSEEHTSELQSLMRISYAVFCLKKKKNTISTQSSSATNNSCRYTKPKTAETLDTAL